MKGFAEGAGLASSSKLWRVQISECGPAGAFFFDDEVWGRDSLEAAESAVRMIDQGSLGLAMGGHEVRAKVRPRVGAASEVDYLVKARLRADYTVIKQVLDPVAAGAPS